MRNSRNLIQSAFGKFENHSGNREIRKIKNRENREIREIREPFFENFGKNGKFLEISRFSAFCSRKPRRERELFVSSRNSRRDRSGTVFPRILRIQEIKRENQKA